MDIIPYGRQQITEDDKKAVLETLGHAFLTQGPAVEVFENTVKTFLRAPFASAVINGTAALHMAALALKVAPGQKVLVATNSFVASANCIRYCGGDVEFVDIDPANLCMDLKALEEKLAGAKKGTYAGAVIVDFAGYAPDMEKARAIADQYGIWLIEDACHALGAEFRTSKGDWEFGGSGKFSDATCFSFHPVKHVATGEGGMTTTARSDVFERLTELRTHGITRKPDKFERNDGPWYYEMQELGFNYRIPDILCALGTSQMKRIESNLKRRREIAKIYSSELSALPLQLPLVPDSVRHAYHLYIVQTDRRDELFAYLSERGIKCQIHYIPIHTQPYYQHLYGKTTLQNVEKYYSRTMSLPMFHALSESDQARVIETIRTFFK